MGKEADQTAVEALAAMSPARRAAQLFAATIANADPTGLAGRAGDLVRGVPWGTTADQISAQVRAASPVADTASKVLGGVGGTKALVAAAPAAITGVRTALTAAPAVGERAAELGAVSTPYATRVAKFLGPAAAALGLGAYLNQADAAPTPAAPITPAAAVKSALAQGAAAVKADPQSALSDEITKVLGHAHSMSDLRSVGALVPAAIKPGTTLKDNLLADVYGQSKAIADQSVQAINAQAAAGTITKDQRDKAITAELLKHFTRTASTLGGYDPSKEALVQPNAGD